MGYAGLAAEATFTGRQGGAWSVAFAPDDRTLASVDVHGVIHLWDTRSGSMDTIASGQGRLWCVSFSPDRRTLATVSQDSTVKLWDLTRDRAYVLIDVAAGHTPSIAFSSDGKAVTAVSDKGSLWKFETLEGHLIGTEQFKRLGRSSVLSFQRMRPSW